MNMLVAGGTGALGCHADGKITVQQYLEKE
jgi:hypothetical protein